MIISLLAPNLLSIFLIYLGNKKDEESLKNAKSLHDVIINQKEDKENYFSYVNVNDVPYKFAVSSDTTDAYYFVSDGKYMYVLYLSLDEFKKLDNETIKEKPIKVTGRTKSVTNEIKKIALDVYNSGLSEDEKISIDEYDLYFGSIYLDTNETGDGSFYFIMFILSLMFSIIMTLIYLLANHRFKKGIKKLSKDEINTIDNELNSKDSFYYEVAHLSLTNNYIVNLGTSFDVIKYSDIIWLYTYTIKTKGVVTSSSIIAFTNNGKKPESIVTEGGGLGSLRIRLEEVGGSMNIFTKPEFVLAVTLPEKGTEYDTNTGTDCRR